MKVEELKIGDWVLYKGKPAKVYSIDPPSIYVDVNREILRTLEDDGDLEPAVLDTDTLKRAGWKWVKGNLWCNAESPLIVRDCDNVFNFYFRGCVYAEDKKAEVLLKRLQYVHELQHILWALGIDDNLKI